MKFGSTEFHTLENLTKDVTVAYKMKLQDRVRQIKDILLYRVPWQEAFEISGPISAAERSQPLWLEGPTSTTEVHHIELPPNFEGYGLPHLVEEQNEWVQYRCSISIQDQKLVCEREVTIIGGKIPAEQFHEFKLFWERCTGSDTADIVLMKSQDPSIA